MTGILDLVLFPHAGCVDLNPQRQIYDDSAVYALSDSNVVFWTEVKSAINTGGSECLTNVQNRTGSD